MTKSEIHRPFTYRISWSKLDKHYYGVRFAKNCSPSELWNTYFTSSKYVTSMAKQHGDPDIIEVRKTFITKKSAILWESKVLRRLSARDNNKWINLHNGDGNFVPTGRPPGFEHSTATKKKMSQAQKGKVNHVWSEDSKKKLSKTKQRELYNMTAEERHEYVKRSCCAPETYTKERSKKISNALIGRKIIKTEAVLAAEEARRNRTPEEKLRCGAKHKNRTWKIIDGKRAWTEKVQ